MHTKIHYRPEVDGLRAIAVISVIVFHADLSFGDKGILTGGYLGVDVFFVISGYLISSIILKGLNEGSFSFADFYERRARRILPVLFAVLLVSMPFAWFLLLPQEMIEYANSVIYSILFSSNFWFLSEDPYWATDSSLKPFLHTWSLAVEEQFYFVMPVLLIVLTRYCKRALFPILIILMLVSLGYAEWASSNAPQFSFYMLPTRMWELLAGTLLAVLELKHGRVSSLWMQKSLPATGMCMILTTCFVFDENTLHPSLLTAIPVAGTMMIVWAASNADIVSRILGSKPFVGIGLVSYGLYMWHYPVFAFGRMIEDKPTHLDKILWVLITLVVTVASYHLLERPFRNRTLVGRKTLAFSLLSTIAICLTYTVSAVQSTGFDARFDDLTRIYRQAEPSNQLLSAQSYTHRIAKKNFSSADNYNVAIFGDSHAKDTFNMLFLNRDQYPGYDFVKMNYSVSRDKGCSLDNGGEKARIQNDRDFVEADLIVISERFRNRENHFRCLGLMIGLLKDQGKAVVLMSLSNVYQVKNSDLLAKKRKEVLKKVRKGDYFSRLYLGRDRKNLTAADIYFWTGDVDNLAEYERLYYDSIKAEVEPINARLEEIASEHQIPFYYKQNYLCDYANKRCPLLDEPGNKLFYDMNHLTLDGARFFGSRMAHLGWFSGHNE